MVTEKIIPKGYKQTDVGVIPDDWEVKRLGELFEITSSKRVFQSEWKTEGIPFYRARELAVLAEEGEVKNELFISKKMHDAFKTIYGVPKIGDMLVTGVGTLGKVYVVSDNYEFYFKDGNIIWFKIEAKVSPDFLRQLYLTPLIIKQIDDNSAGTTVGTYTISGAKKTTIPFPPLPEQNSIATVLVDIDALTTNLKELIAKKRNIEQGAMQELLTGKKRLPGFSGKWEVKLLGELFKFSGGYSASREELSDEGYCYLHYGDIHKSNKTYINVSEEYTNIPKLNIPINRVSNESLLNEGDVVFVDASEDDEGASKHIVVRNPEKIKYISGLHTIVSKSKDDTLDNTYKQYCFQTRNMKKQFYFYAVGTKVTGISKTNIAKIEIPVPPKEEQIAIAETLSAMAEEIEELEQKLDKYKMIKQGMMQELLTGRTRLI